MRYHTTWWDTIIYTKLLSLSCLPLHMLRLSIITLSLDFWVISWIEFKYKYNLALSLFSCITGKAELVQKCCIHWEFWSMCLQLDDFHSIFYVLHLLSSPFFQLLLRKVRKEEGNALVLLYFWENCKPTINWVWFFFFFFWEVWLWSTAFEQKNSNCRSLVRLKGHARAGIIVREWK